MDIEIKKKFKLLPAKPGTCAFCATDHSGDVPHNLRSLFYQVRFKIKYGRYPTWADAAAHLTVTQRDAWRQAMKETAVEWTEPIDDEVISEPYAMRDP